MNRKERRAFLRAIRRMPSPIQKEIKRRIDEARKAKRRAANKRARISRRKNR